MHLSDWLKNKELTDQQFAEMIGCSRSAVTHYRSGRRMPSVYAMMDIQVATNHEVKWEDMQERWVSVRKNLSL